MQMRVDRWSSWEPVFGFSQMGSSGGVVGVVSLAYAADWYASLRSAWGLLFAFPQLDVP